MKKGGDSMAQKGRAESAANVEIKFSGNLEFEGSLSQFKAVMDGVGKLSDRGLKIGSWPTPDHPAGTLMIETVPLPENPRRGVMIDTVPLPEQPPPGIFPFARLLPRTVLDRMTEGRPRFKLIEDINGGIRNCHIHIGDEVVLLNPEDFRELVVNAAKEVSGKLADEMGFTPTVRALERLGRGIM